MTNLAHNLQATAGSHPHRIALRQGDVLFTYAQLNGEVARAAAWLADKGVRPGDRVAIMIPNVYAFPLYRTGFHRGEPSKRAGGDSAVPTGRRIRRRIELIARADIVVRARFGLNPSAP